MTDSLNEARLPASLADDLLDGVSEIAQFFGKAERPMYHLLETGAVAGAFKMGRRWHLRKSTALAQIAEAETKPLTRAPRLPSQRVAELRSAPKPPSETGRRGRGRPRKARAETVAETV